ncbi:hypothetical protein SEVIR_1G199150v4 [Setaria viridis]
MPPPHPLQRRESHIPPPLEIAATICISSRCIGSCSRTPTLRRRRIPPLPSRRPSPALRRRPLLTLLHLHRRALLRLLHADGETTLRLHRDGGPVCSTSSTPAAEPRSPSTGTLVGPRSPSTTTAAGLGRITREQREKKRLAQGCVLLALANRSISVLSLLLSLSFLGLVPVTSNI